jgi:hypothetical protein
LKSQLHCASSTGFNCARTWSVFAVRIGVVVFEGVVLVAFVASLLEQAVAKTNPKRPNAHAPKLR